MTRIDARPGARVALTAPERKARRARLFTWLLPAVGVLLIASLAVLTQQLLEGGLGEQREPTTEEVSAANTTQFGQAGIAYATRHQVVTLNLASLPIAAEELAMEPDARVTISPGYGFLDTTVYRGRGGGLDGEGYFTEMMSSVTATTAGGDLERLEMERSPVGWAEFPSAMRAVGSGAAAFGWQVDDADIAGFTDEAAEAVRAGAPVEWRIPAGDAMDLPVSGQVYCSGEGMCVLGYAVDVSGAGG